MSDEPSIKELVDSLAAYPHIQNKILYCWGTQAARDYLHSLKIADRPNRQGFPLEIIIVIDLLSRLHSELYPNFEPKPDHWVYRR